jgi:hypothetical protein
LLRFTQGNVKDHYLNSGYFGDLGMYLVSVYNTRPRITRRYKKGKRFHRPEFLSGCTDKRMTGEGRQPTICRNTLEWPLSAGFQPFRPGFWITKIERRLSRNHRTVKSQEKHHCHRQLTANSGPPLKQVALSESIFSQTGSAT